MARTTEYFVAPTGNDRNPGTRRRPFATLERARDAVREARKEGLRKNIRVVISCGTYFLEKPLRFGPEDSGSDQFSITYAAAEGETPIISGGRPITGWKKGPGSLWVVELPEVKAGKWYFRELFVNGRRSPRARSPNEGFFRVVKAGSDNRTSFTFRQGNLKTFTNLEDAEIVFLHDWSVSRVRIATVDEEKCEVRLADPIGSAATDFYAITGFEPNPRYYVENAHELLDSPGEWYLDRRSGILSYWPLADEDMTRSTVVAPMVERILVVDGMEEVVRGLRFEGLAFMHCAFPLPEHGYAEGQAGFYEVRPNPEKNWAMRRNPAAVVFRQASKCTLNRCEVAHVGGSGVSIEGRSESNRIVGCHIYDVGGNGIMVGETTDKPDLLAKNNTVANNLVHDCGALFHGCVGIWVGLTEGTVIMHNDVCDLPYTGISVGWQWNDKPTQCQNNILKANHIHDVMQLLSDGGGIYTLGR